MAKLKEPLDRFGVEYEAEENREMSKPAYEIRVNRGGLKFLVPKKDEGVPERLLPFSKCLFWRNGLGRDWLVGGTSDEGREIVLGPGKVTLEEDFNGKGLAWFSGKDKNQEWLSGSKDGVRFGVLIKPIEKADFLGEPWFRQEYCTKVTLIGGFSNGRGIWGWWQEGRERRWSKVGSFKELLSWSLGMPVLGQQDSEPTGNWAIALWALNQKRKEIELAPEIEAKIKKIARSASHLPIGGGRRVDAGEATLSRREVEFAWKGIADEGWWVGVVENQFGFRRASAVLEEGFVKGEFMAGLPHKVYHDKTGQGFLIGSYAVGMNATDVGRLKIKLEEVRSQKIAFPIFEADKNEGHAKRRLVKEGDAVLGVLVIGDRCYAPWSRGGLEIGFEEIVAPEAILMAEFFKVGRWWRSVQPEGIEEFEMAVRNYFSRKLGVY